MTTRLVLICHASTNAVRKSAFPADEPLDELGATDAAAFSSLLPAADRVWTGPERRARQTAAALGLDAIAESRLRDCDYGAWAGCTFEDVHAHDPKATEAWLRDPAATPHGGESILSLMRRVADWLSEQQAHHRQSIAVTHAAVIRAGIVHAIRAAPETFWRIDIAPLSMTRLSGMNGRWNLGCSGCPP